MSLSRKTFLKSLGWGAIGLGTARLWAGSEVAVLPSLPDYVVGSDEPFWSAVRQAYRFDPAFHYFNTGGLGPSIEGVRSLVGEIEASLERHIETGHVHHDEIRAEMAAFLGCDSDEVAFVRNATEGNGIVAGGLELGAGDEVIFESHAHPGGSFAWLLQAKRRGVAVRVFEPDSESAAGNLERIKALVTSRTRVVQVSDVTAPTGIVMPVREIATFCRERGIWFHIDGAQSAGMFPFNLHEIGCDSYATSGHKWLGAPRETGVLVVRRARQDEVTPPVVGAYSGEVDGLPGNLTFTPTAGRYEYGTRDVAKVVGLAGAIRWQNHVGRERIAVRGRALIARLRAGLAALPDLEILTPAGPQLSAAMLTFRSSRLDYNTLFNRLLTKHDLRCRPVSEQGLDALRVSCHLFNSVVEVDRLVEAIDAETRSV